jgi:uncharacterized glyoxalase superfamily metalloenzyme YdcJ
MNTAITHDRIERYAYVLNDLLAVAEAHTQGRVRRPRQVVVDLLDAMTNACIMLNCQVSGGPQPQHHDIEAIRQQAARVMASTRRRA